MEVTESGNYAVEVFAVLEKDGTTLTSLGAKSDPVKCTVTPHEYEEKWSSDGKVHWHECTICKNKTDVAYIMANYGMEVIDSGVAVLNMHAPYEVSSKADVYEAVKGYRAFLRME